LGGAAPDEFARIDRELERVNALIGRVLTAARLERATTLDDADVVDLPALIADVTLDAALEADARGVAIRVRGVPAARIVGHRELLRIAVENVVRNALRYSPPRSAITLDIERQVDTTTVIVRDQGPGVEEVDLPKLFDPFFRTSDARVTYPDGSGLGLAMTRRIVERHRGSVTAARNEGGGLAITMTFPVSTEIERRRSVADEIVPDTRH
jgi:signal transduction histidine kinase